MNRLLPLMICAAAFAGCRTAITPDQSWSDYGRYYNPTGEAAELSASPATVREVKSKDADATIETLKSQGYVVLGSFKIDDGTEISRNAVAALAQKLNAAEVVWITVNALPKSAKAVQSPDMGIVGVDNTQLARMNADRPDQTFAEQVLEGHHTIWMLGKKK